MKSLVYIVTLLLASLLLLGMRPSDSDFRTPRGAPPATATPVSVTHSVNGPDLFVHLPPHAAQHQPLRVLVALHGVGMRGEHFAQRLIDDADRSGWVLVAPTFTYRDWMDPHQLLADDLKYTQKLNAILETLPQRTGLKLRKHALIYGFSRGAQLAHRFAMFYPERAEAVVAISAGSYTLPSVNQAMPLPYGVGDLRKHLGRSADLARFKQIPFWIAVGAEDQRAGDAPRAFDAYIGKTRVDRAGAFHQALRAIGMDAWLGVFPNADHEITSEMQTGALEFMRGKSSDPTES